MFRAVESPVYAEALSGDLERARAQVDEEDLDRLLKSGYTWTVE